MQLICAFALNRDTHKRLKNSSLLNRLLELRMTIDKDILLSLLKCTKTGPVSKRLLVKVSKVPAEAAEMALSKFSQMSLFDQYGDIVEASPSQRVKMSIRAIQLGADFQHTCSLLSWAEFEDITARALETNNYRVMRNLHFRNKTKKWEIDIIGLRKPIILCVDCKHWRRGWRSAASLKAVEAQIERTEAFADALPNYAKRIKLEAWQTATFIPLILSLLPGPEKFHNKVPVVPVLQLQDFINNIPLEVDLLLHIHRIFTVGPTKLTDFSKKASEIQM